MRRLLQVWGVGVVVAFLMTNGASGLEKQSPVEGYIALRPPRSNQLTSTRRKSNLSEAMTSYLWETYGDAQVDQIREAIVRIDEQKFDIRLKYKGDVLKNTKYNQLTFQQQELAEILEARRLALRDTWEAQAPRAQTYNAMVWVEVFVNSALGI